MSDSAYAAKYIGIARMLWEASERNLASIPVDYSEHLRHEYSDGSVSLAHLLPLFTHEEGLENWEFDEAIELLGKVRPEDWPNESDILQIDLEELLEKREIEEEEEFSFIEDNLGTAEKVEKTLQSVLTSAFGERVDKIRSRSGDFPKASNRFLQESDGTFSGTFEFNDLKFLFEIVPTESGWLVTYRMNESSLDNLAPIPMSEDPKLKKKDETRSATRGWK